MAARWASAARGCLGMAAANCVESPLGVAKLLPLVLDAGRGRAQLKGFVGLAGLGRFSGRLVVHRQGVVDLSGSPIAGRRADRAVEISDCAGRLVGGIGGQRPGQQGFRPAHPVGPVDCFDVLHLLGGQPLPIGRWSLGDRLGAGGLAFGF